MSMPVFCLEMRSTQNWEDVRYRQYTTSQRKIAAFKAVPKIQFTDSGHGIVPVVIEVSGKRKQKLIFALNDYVSEGMKNAAQ